MGLFYCCTEKDCNRKYKTPKKLVEHLLDAHEKIVNEADLPEPYEITDTNKKEVNEKVNKNKKDEERQKKKQEILAKQELSIKAKAEAEARFKEIETQKQLEICQQELKNKELSALVLAHELDLEMKRLEMVEKVQENFAKNNTECVICQCLPADTAPTPCGHLNFCYECIDTYFKGNPNKGCPICRKNIIMITKIYK